MCHYTHLTSFEREKILFFLAEGKSITEIAHLLKRSKSTISRAFRRNAAPTGRSDALPRYPRRTADPPRSFSEVRTSETMASRETASQERQRRTSWQVRHIAPHRRASCQCSEPFRPWPLGSGYCGGQARKGMPRHTGGAEKPVLA